MMAKITSNQIQTKPKKTKKTKGKEIFLGNNNKKKHKEEVKKL